MLPIVQAGACRLKLDDPQTQTRYLEHLETFFDEHQILHKAQQIKNELETQTLQTHHEEELERLDALQI